uniref:Integrase catalytic domain-containing protein n=1 Tax=Megaselia scalaris TaxID=36166 RepID=T1GDT5_MEGSC
MVERFNRTIEKHLIKVVRDHQKDCDAFMPLFLMAYRSTIHESTFSSPVKIIFGSDLRLIVDLRFGKPEKDLTNDKSKGLDINEYLFAKKEELEPDLI